MKKTVIFGGTSEGRILAKYCDDSAIDAIVCVATEYGSDMLEEYKNIRVEEGRKDENEMEAFFTMNNVGRVYDATHPYAVIVSENIMKACEKAGIECVRVLREDRDVEEDLRQYTREFFCIEDAVSYLKGESGNILIATGSKELHKYKELETKRLFPRVLPNAAGIAACEEIGVPNSNIIAMQGPFDTDSNVAMLKKYGCKYLVTKQSGDIGGFSEKIEACKKAGAKALIITRPRKEEGISLESALKALEELASNEDEAFVKLSRKADIKIAGLGIGNLGTMTFEVHEAIKNADLIIGAKRLVDCALEIKKDADCRSYISYNPTEICRYIYEEAKENDKILVVMSGDTGFFSGTNKLGAEFSKMLSKGYFNPESRLEILSGISSFSYMCAKFGIDYTNMKIMSVHGRDENLSELFEAVKYNEKTFSLSSGGEQVNYILRKLSASSLSEVSVCIAENMGASDEKYTKGKPEELKEREFSKLTSLIFINEGADSKRTLFGLADEEFLRDKVPMTKSDIRAVCMAKLELCRDSICYDIGAGSGSCSIEMADFVCRGKVYAIEHKALACELIAENKKKFELSNIEIINAEASTVIDDLEAADRIFIGGSGGNLDIIVDKIYKKNPEAIIVVTAITLETITQINNIVKKYEKAGYTYEVSWISFANNKTVAGYNMMIGGNPVLIAKIKNKKR